MRQRVVLTLLAMCLAGSAAFAAPPADDFKAMMEKALKAWATMDPANAAPFYAKDASLAFYDVMPLKYTGWTEYAAGVQKLVANFRSLAFTMGSDAQTHQSGKTAWTTATVHVDWVSKDGAKEAFDARWTLVWEKRGKDWLIVHEHFSRPEPSPEETAGQPLYKRVGGYDAIAAVVDDFIGRLIADRQISRFFAGSSTDSKQRIRQLVVDQLCAATGGPCIYTGRSMKASHEGLGITESDWQATVKHLVATLDKFKVPQKEKDEMLAIASSLKGDIVEM